MLVQDLIEQLETLPQDAEIRIRYGIENQVSDIGTEFICDDEGIGEYYLIVSSGDNIQTSYIDD